MSSLDIVAIGEPMVEFSQTKPGEPNYLQGFGGDTSNAMIAAARSGARAGYVTRVGDDEMGRMLHSLWRAEGIDTRGVTTDRRAPTGLYLVHHGPQGHAFSYWRAGSAASRMQPADVPAEVLRGTRIVHASGISLAISEGARDTVIAAFAMARASGAKVSFDTNLRPKQWPLDQVREPICAAAAGADYLFTNYEDACALSGQMQLAALIDWAHRLGAKAMFLTFGARGAIASDGTRRERLAGIQVAAVDATGAGDCFCGAALARIAAGDDALAAARYANAAAALSTTGFGAVAPLPSGEAVRDLLSRL